MSLTMDAFRDKLPSLTVSPPKPHEIARVEPPLVLAHAERTERKSLPPLLMHKKPSFQLHEATPLGIGFSLVKSGEMTVLTSPQHGLYVTNIDPSKHIVVVARSYIDDKEGKVLINIGLGLYNKEIGKDQIKKITAKLKEGNSLINRTQIVVYGEGALGAGFTYLVNVIAEVERSGVISKVKLYKLPLQNFSTLSIDRLGKIEYMVPPPSFPKIEG